MSSSQNPRGGQDDDHFRLLINQELTPDIGPHIDWYCYRKGLRQLKNSLPNEETHFELRNFFQAGRSNRVLVYTRGFPRNPAQIRFVMRINETNPPNDAEATRQRRFFFTCDGGHIYHEIKISTWNELFGGMQLLETHDIVCPEDETKINIEV